MFALHNTEPQHLSHRKRLHLDVTDLELDTDDGEQHFALPGITAFRRYSSLLNISEINVHLTRNKIISFFIHSLEIFPEISLFSHKADI